MSKSYRFVPPAMVTMVVSRCCGSTKLSAWLTDWVKCSCDGWSRREGDRRVAIRSRRVQRHKQLLVRRLVRSRLRRAESRNQVVRRGLRSSASGRS